MNFKAIIFGCDDKELINILDCMMIRNKRLMSTWINEHPDMIEPPVEPEEKIEPAKLSDQQTKELSELTLGIIPTVAENRAIGASLEDVIKEVSALDYTREQILDSIGFLLDHGDAYEPEVGFIQAVCK